MPLCKVRLPACTRVGNGGRWMDHRISACNCLPVAVFWRKVLDEDVNDIVEQQSKSSQIVYTHYPRRVACIAWW